MKRKEIAMKNHKKKRRYIRIGIWYHRNARIHLEAALLSLQIGDKEGYERHMHRYARMIQYFDLAAQIGIDLQRQMLKK
jgi:hypothetical protein